MVVTDKLTPGKWHEIKMDISRAGHVLVSIDGITAVDETRQLQYKVDEILIGSGFSETRPFVGEIEVDSISYKSFEENTLLTRAMLYWVIFVFISIVVNFTKIFIEVAISLKKTFVRVIISYLKKFVRVFISYLKKFVRVIISYLRKFVRAMIRLDKWSGH